jgi:hypothetical protein
MEAGRVITGFSYPTVAKYNAEGRNVTYTDGMRLARGVKVGLSVNVSEQSNFYADNKVAESDGGVFTDGKATLTVDGLHSAADRFIHGLPEPEEVTYGDSKKAKFTKHGDKAAPPYVGIGFIIQYQSGGVTTYVPMILTKGKFPASGLDAETAGEKKNYQTQELEPALFRDDTAGHNWKWVGEDVATEEEALAIIDGILSVTAPTEVQN